MENRVKVREKTTRGLWRVLRKRHTGAESQERIPSVMLYTFASPCSVQAISGLPYRNVFRACRRATACSLAGRYRQVRATPVPDQCSSSAPRLEVAL